MLLHKRIRFFRAGRMFKEAFCNSKTASVRFIATFRRSKALVRRCGSGGCLGPHCSELLCESCNYTRSPALGYNGKRLQPNNSFKLMSLRGAVFCGNVYHNAAPLRATA